MIFRQNLKKKWSFFGASDFIHFDAPGSRSNFFEMSVVFPIIVLKYKLNIVVYLASFFSLINVSTKHKNIIRKMLAGKLTNDAFHKLVKG